LRYWKNRPNRSGVYIGPWSNMGSILDVGMRIPILIVVFRAGE
jgi:hypothetical protein